MKAERVQVYWQGLVAGLVGYATVAIVMAIANVLLGRSPFHTAALLGQTLFYGPIDPSQLTIWAGPVLAYNGFHLLIFLVLGVAAAWLAQLSERGPHFWYIGTVLMLFVAFHLFGALMLVGERFPSGLSPWALLGAGFAAMVTMSAYLVWAHPRLRSEMSVRRPGPRPGGQATLDSLPSDRDEAGRSRASHPVLARASNHWEALSNSVSAASRSVQYAFDRAMAARSGSLRCWMAT
jgi:hypothetical protein